MNWLFSIRNIIYPKRYIWTPVRIIYETDKAILVDNGKKTWIPKSQIYQLRLKNNTFEIYIKEGYLG